MRIPRRGTEFTRVNNTLKFIRQFYRTQRDIMLRHIRETTAFKKEVFFFFFNFLSDNFLKICYTFVMGAYLKNFLINSFFAIR